MFNKRQKEHSAATQEHTAKILQATAHNTKLRTKSYKHEKAKFLPREENTDGLPLHPSNIRNPPSVTGRKRFPPKQNNLVFIKTPLKYITRLHPKTPRFQHLKFLMQSRTPLLQTHFPTKRKYNLQKKQKEIEAVDVEKDATVTGLVRRELIDYTKKMPNN